MQQSQRAVHNDALEYAAGRANELSLPLLAVFGLTDDYPEANARHYAFMLEGLKDAGETLRDRGIQFVVGRGSPDEVALRYGERASLIVTDGAYLRPEKAWKQLVAEEAGCLVIGVESNVVVPVELASNKREHAARTLRPKIHKHLDHFLVALEPTKVEHDSLGLDVEDGVDLSDIDAVLDGMDLDEGAWPLRGMYTGGATAGREALACFLKENFAEYVEHRNQPQTSDVSHMSKYLHYGHLSPVYVVLEVMNSGGPEDDIDSYVEEVVVRRELSMNFCFYTPDYDSYSCLPDWAKKTLEEHKGDEREYVYTRKQLENAETHDPYWNAAMREMVHTGYMHNHMRMYWGKKILEWSNTPEYAYETTLYLNDKYFVDGRDANSYANIAWVFGNHDRGWKERDVLGKIRYMSAGGLERKAKPKEYVEKVERLVEEGRPEAL
ncbi:deoxyribodipyrimidine photolyase [Rubrobacter marinus]|uniref:Deoxyribodipyrimidine photo-lyase n=2 Tax=Rubrobacter marinus TaxID=2653852 RepID=A0A6G8Q398_9ACTN|nr:deoxyribodipyrimidine photolyase [Rubrobacter marinus]